MLGTGGDQWVRLVSGMGSEMGFEYHACGFYPRLIKELDLDFCIASEMYWTEYPQISRGTPLESHFRPGPISLQAHYERFFSSTVTSQCFEI